MYRDIVTNPTCVNSIPVQSTDAMLCASSLEQHLSDTSPIPFPSRELKVWWLWSRCSRLSRSSLSPVVSGKFAGKSGSSGCLPWFTNVYHGLMCHHIHHPVHSASGVQANDSALLNQFSIRSVPVFCERLLFMGFQVPFKK